MKALIYLTLALCNIALSVWAANHAIQLFAQL